MKNIENKTIRISVRVSEEELKIIEKYHKNEENLNRSGGRVVIPICE